MTRSITGHIIGKSRHEGFEKSHFDFGGINIDVKTFVHRENVAVDARMYTVFVHYIGIECHGHALGIP